MAELVAKTYSQALFEVGLDNNNLDVFMEELKVVRDMFREYPDFYEILISPKINTEEKKKIVDEVFKGKATNEINNFMKILLDKRRVKDLYSIVEQFENLIYEHKGIVKATAITTVLLGKDEKDSLTKKLESITGKEVELINEIDKSVLGGVLIKLGDQVIDGTLKGKLNNLQISLKEIIV
jgi:F-type H+-transporting ATPase subunit delta